MRVSPLFKKNLIAAAMAAAITGNAQAFCCGDGAVAAAGSLAAGSTVATAVAGAATAITGTLTAATLTLSWLINESTGQVIGALEGIMKVGAFANTDALNAHKNAIIMAMLANEKARIAAEQSLATLPLANQTGAAAVAAKQGEEAKGVVSSAANAALSKRYLQSKNDESSLLSAFMTAQKKYGSGSALPDADILADSLLAGPSTRQQSAKKYTYTSDQLQAAQDFVVNAIDAMPPEDLSDSTASTVEGKRYRMMLRGEKARLSLSFRTFADALAARTAIKGFAPGSQIGMDATGDISYREFMAHEIKRRYNNPSWYEQVAGATPTNLQREALFMKALDLHLRFEESKSLEKIELLLAQMNANQVVSSPQRQKLEAQYQRTRVR